MFLIFKSGFEAKWRKVESMQNLNPDPFWIQNYQQSWAWFCKTIILDPQHCEIYIVSSWNSVWTWRFWILKRFFLFQGRLETGSHHQLYRQDVNLSKRVLKFLNYSEWVAQGTVVHNFNLIIFKFPAYYSYLEHNGSWNPVAVYGLQYLFLEPNPEDPLNKDAALELQSNR
jgi:hypothetical protein